MCGLNMRAGEIGAAWDSTVRVIGAEVLCTIQSTPSRVPHPKGKEKDLDIQISPALWRSGKGLGHLGGSSKFKGLKSSQNTGRKITQNVPAGDPFMPIVLQERFI